jgi:hypothetical protein
LTAPQIIHEQRLKNLDRFEEALERLGVLEAHEAALRAASSTTGLGDPRHPRHDDLVGLAAYQAAAHAALAEAIELKLKAPEAKATKK